MLYGRMRLTDFNERNQSISQKFVAEMLLQSKLIMASSNGIEQYVISTRFKQAGLNAL